MKSTLILCGTIFLFLNSCQRKLNESAIETTSSGLIHKKNTFYKGWFKTPHNLQAKVTDFYITPSRDTTVKISTNGTVIHIPKNAFVDEKGRLISTKVKLSFKEFKNSADIAFSGIPMTFVNSSGVEFNFNSSGMFDIRGTTLGSDVQIADDKKLTIDYHLAKKNDDIDFFFLDEKTNQWAQIQEIAPDPVLVKKDKENNQQINVNEEKKVPIKFDEDDARLISVSFNQFKDIPELQPYKNVKFRVSTKSTFFPNEDELCHWFHFDATDTPIYGEYAITLKGLKNDGSTLTRNYIVEPVFEGEDFEKAVELFKKQYDRELRIKKLISDRPKRNRSDVANTSNKGGNRTAGTLLLDGATTDPGHTYPNIVKGLQMSNFGVYNCDQIYRVGTPIFVKANYVDDKGIAIEDGHVISVIDLNYNGAFSFDPKGFRCNAKGDNVLLLTTKSGELYIFDKGQFQNLNLTSNCDVQFVMTKITETITSSEELANYLGLPS